MGDLAADTRIPAVIGHEGYLWDLDNALKRAEAMHREQAAEFLEMSKNARLLADETARARDRLRWYRESVIQERVEFMRR